MQVRSAQSTGFLPGLINDVSKVPPASKEKDTMATVRILLAVLAVVLLALSSAQNLEDGKHGNGIVNGSWGYSSCERGTGLICFRNKVLLNIFRKRGGNISFQIVFKDWKCLQ